MSFGDNAQTKALYALMDTVEALAQAQAAGQPRAQDWADRVTASFDAHRKALRTEEDAWKEHSVAVSAMEKIEDRAAAPDGPVGD